MTEKKVFPNNFVFCVMLGKIIQLLNESVDGNMFHWLPKSLQNLSQKQPNANSVRYCLKNYLSE